FPFLHRESVTVRMRAPAQVEPCVGRSSFCGLAQRASHLHEATLVVLSESVRFASAQRVSLSPVIRHTASTGRFIDARARHGLRHELSAFSSCWLAPLFCVRGGEAPASGASLVALWSDFVSSVVRARAMRS